MKTTGRSSSRTGNARKWTSRETLEHNIRDASEIILKEHDPTIRRPALDVASFAAGYISSTIAVQTQSVQRNMAVIQPHLEEMCSRFVASLIEVMRAEVGTPSLQKAIPMPTILMGAPLETAGPAVDWAGPVAGPTTLERHYGIARSTLFRWQKRNEVVALRTGGKRFVFPLRQFVDGRPVSGLSDVLKLFCDSRAAWAWLTWPCETLAGKTPLDELVSDNVLEVAAAARLLKQP